MNVSKATADIFVPDNTELSQAMAKTTHLCIVAHQDDTEIAAYHGIAECFGRQDKWFSSVIVTNGAGSARTGIYGQYTDEEMQAVRRVEQRKAACLGDYAYQLQLDYASSEVKDVDNQSTIDDIYQILEVTKPEVVYLHNPADKHDTHVGVLLRALAALRKLPEASKPKKVYGCEVWRDLDWLNDDEKQVLDCSKYDNMASALVSLFDSQISGGKRYDLATAGRRLANATYFASHGTDECTAMNYAIDLTPLVQDPALSIKDFTLAAIDRFKNDVAAKLEKLG